MKFINLIDEEDFFLCYHVYIDMEIEKGTPYKRLYIVHFYGLVCLNKKIIPFYMTIDTYSNTYCRLDDLVLVKADIIVKLGNEYHGTDVVFDEKKWVDEIKWVVNKIVNLKDVYINMIFDGKHVADEFDKFRFFDGILPRLYKLQEVFFRVT